MSQFTSFDGLPLIVHDCILRSMPSPKDVANTIRASPGSLRAFATGRRSILLSAMRNFLSLKNQHLMNLVIAAPQYYHHRRYDYSPTDEPHDFNRAVNAYIRNRDLRPLTLDNFDNYIRLYAVFAKAILGYGLFTLARSQNRVPKPSTREATRSRYQFTDCDLLTPEEEESSRIWRGFLIYELVCIMHGVPRIKDAASSQRYDASYKVLLEMSEAFYDIPTYVQEEVMCVQQYVQEQYDLTFNELVESFEVAVGGIGQRAWANSASPTAVTMPMFDLEWETLLEPVEYLFRPPFYSPSLWSANMAALGISFLQRFLSWNASTRLDFTRITYPFLSNWEQCRVGTFLKTGINYDDLTAKDFGWSQEFIDELAWNRRVDESTQLRLRAVGWIFWRNYDRLFFMNLDEDGVDRTYGRNGSMCPHVRLHGRPHLLETLVEIKEWESIVQQFGSSFSDNQLNDIKGMFKSIGDLNSRSVADVVSTLRSQHEEDARNEAQKNGD